MFLRTLISILFICAMSLPTAASVVMQSNRVIYDASEAQRNIKFTNNDNFPYIVQVWASASDEKQPIANENIPFAVSPGIFKMQGKQDQIINLLYTNSKLKLDKEQIYYLHFTQVPSVIAGDRDKNKLVLIVNSVVKIFLRPTNLSISYDKMFDYIHYSVTRDTTGCNLVIDNRSPYYLNSIGLTTALNSPPKNTAIKMIAPLSQYTLQTACVNSGAKPEVSISFINDYGVVQKQTLKEK
ncbi:fimbrial biogenesis chaperone [Kluyvera intermedia]|uniref:fimbrial biogenesis chaperone n=1 Tax=Kluyvera intermedia TaxID=61648 RepID=UPI00372D0336